MARKPSVTDERIIEFLKMGLNNAAICREFGKTQDQLNTRINILREKFNKERFSDGVEYGKKKAKKFAEENKVQLPEGMKRAAPEQEKEKLKKLEVATFEAVAKEYARKDAEKFATAVLDIRQKIENLCSIPEESINNYNNLLHKYNLGGANNEERD